MTTLGSLDANGGWATLGAERSAISLIGFQEADPLFDAVMSNAISAAHGTAGTAAARGGGGERERTRRQEP
jgi:hypothetical protein